VMGGVILDLGRWILPNITLAYGLVFVVQAIGMLTAIWLLGRVNVNEFRSNTKAAIVAVMGGELD
jgi:BCD family chlorophyll transporter-like MFS transporter